MKKLMILLIAMAVCVCSAGCIKGTESQNGNGSVAATEIPRSSEQDAAVPSTKEEINPVESVPQTTVETTQATIGMPEQGELSQSPTADYHLPPDERPGDRVTNVPKI